MTDLAPSSLAEWWNVGVGAVAALGTIGAVFFSVWTSVRAQADAKQARKDTAAAEARALEATHRQAAAAEDNTKTQRELEHGRFMQQQKEDAERRAARSAAGVQVAVLWTQTSSDSEFQHPFWARVEFRVANTGTSSLHQVELRRLQTNSAVPIDFEHVPVDQIGPRADVELQHGYFPVSGMEWGDRFDATLWFTDAFGDRWELKPDGSLTLLRARKIEMGQVDTEPNVEA
jgi:hypothetical protein